MKSSLLLVSLLGCLATCHADAVRLKIIGPDEKPVAGAKVHVVEASLGSWSRETEATLDLQSDEAGRVAFESKNPLPGAKDERAPNTIVVMAQVKAAGLARKRTALKAGDNTLILQRGRTLGGVVLGEEEKPVAGVRIRLTSFDLARDESEHLYFPDDQEPQTQSDAQGKWSFADLPLEGAALVTVTDSAFKNETFCLDVAQDAPMLFLERGATIKGRLLRPDGTPASGVKFDAGDSTRKTTTRVDGTFEVNGLGEESVYLQVPRGSWNPEELPFIVPLKPVEGLKPGETRDIGDWKTEAGVRTKGRVVEEGTQKPVPGASVDLWGRGSGGNGQSDITGAFDFLASPGAIGLGVSADGFVWQYKFFSQQKQEAPTPKSGVIDLGTIALQRGEKVMGTIKNEAGAAFSFGLSLYAGGQANRVYARSGAKDGQFVFDGLAKGDYTIKSDEFKIVSGDKFSVGATPAILSVVAEGKERTSTASKVEGRVLDEAQKPVAGAKIKLLFHNVGGSYSDLTVVSNGDGTYSAPMSTLNATPKVAGVTRPGFILVTSALKEENGVWRGDILLHKRA